MRHILLMLALVMVVLLAGPPASGDFYQDIYRGLRIASTPSGYPLFSAGDGTLVNGQRRGRLRILPDQIGKGYTLDFERAFGPDSTGAPEVIDLGALELELQGSIGATLSYTSRGFLIGNADISASNLNYALRAKTGAQDNQIVGTFNLSETLEVNEFGFYRLNLQASNTGSFFIQDGVLVENTDETNFDIGPIVIDGNIFYDALLSIFTVLGADTTELEAVFPGSPIDRINAEIREALSLDPIVAGYLLSDEAEDELVGPPEPGAATTEELVSAFMNGELDLGQTGDGTQGVPEPGALLLIGLGAAAFWRRR